MKDKLSEFATDETRKSFSAKSYSVPKSHVSRKQLSTVTKRYFEDNTVEERKSLAEEDVSLQKHPVDKKKQVVYGAQFFCKDITKEKENACHQKINCWFDSENIHQTRKEKKDKSYKKSFREELSEQKWNELTRSGNREQNIDSLIKIIKSRLRLICVGSKKLYVFGGKIYEDISDRKLAAACFKEVLAEKTNRLFKDYSEIHNQLLSDPEIAVISLDEVPTNRDVVVFPNGTFNIREKRFYENQFWEEDYIFSMLAIEYDETDVSGKKVIDNFLNTFCAGLEERKRLFCEILGFCLSNYENKKACFYFLGAPDAGKSTVCRFIE